MILLADETGKRTFFVMTKLVPEKGSVTGAKQRIHSASHIPIAIVDKMARISPTYLRSETNPVREL